MDSKQRTPICQLNHSKIAKDGEYIFLQTAVFGKHRARDLWRKTPKCSEVLGEWIMKLFLLTTCYVHITVSVHPYKLILLRNSSIGIRVCSYWRTVNTPLYFLITFLLEIP